MAINLCNMEILKGQQFQKSESKSIRYPGTWKGLAKMETLRKDKQSVTDELVTHLDSSTDLVD